MNHPHSSRLRQMRLLLFSAAIMAISATLQAALPSDAEFENLFYVLKDAETNGLQLARSRANDLAHSNGDELGYHSTDAIEYKTFSGSYTPPELPADKQGRFVYGLAVFSDDGSRVTINGKILFDRHAIGQALPKIGLSFRELPMLLEPGKPVDVQLDYSNMFYTSDGEADIDGGMFFLYLVPAEIVPDFNRDGRINRQDSGKVTEDNPWRWWINDDDDRRGYSGMTDGNGDTPDTYSTDAYDSQVDGLRDLVDFFPIRLKLKAVLDKFSPNEYSYRLRHEDGAVKFVEMPSAVPSQVKGAAGHLYDIAIAKSLQESKCHWTHRSNYRISDLMLDAISRDEGLLLCEGVEKTDKPLKLVVEHNQYGTVLTLSLPILLNPVEDMYRHLNLRNQLAAEHCGKPGKNSIQMDDPGPPYPDKWTNGIYFVYIHGFANDADVARAAQAEIFKRLYQMGSRARFVGVSWHGDTGVDYHHAVHHAFLTGNVLPQWLGRRRVVVAAHSLGNIVASQAVEYGNLNVKNYFMINAASPIEAYDSNQLKGTDNNPMYQFMTEQHWQPYLPYREKLFAADWWKLFPKSDGRSKLTWKGRFSRKVPQVATNFYSTGEDVVRNPDYIMTPTKHLVKRIREFNFQEQSWPAQEISKGSNMMIMERVLEDTHAGWAFNRSPYWKGIQKNPDWLKYIDTLVPKSKLKTEPFYEPFKYPELYNDKTGSAKANDLDVQYRLLATAIPAMSYAVAANPVDAIRKAGNKNINMMDLKVDGKWPRDTGSWRHGDFRSVALCYVYKMYEKIISAGGLND